MNYKEVEKETDIVRIETNFGDIVVCLDGKAAPETVKNFKTLVGRKFYDGLIFHRVISGFMIQGGDPTGTGCGGSDRTVKGEFAVNGVKNPLSHTRGVISMARSAAYDSASSQFFICHADAKFLDGQYASFGKVEDGMDAVDKIASVGTDGNDRPFTECLIKRAVFAERA
jgi:peptidyl-prolyl cis-trans isomerase B (cyclophilin B)